MKYLYRCLLLICTLAAFGCGNTEAPTSYQCEKKPELLHQAPSCVSTAMCPCGSRCSFGVCSFECIADTDCGKDGVCDVFGRCGTETAQPLALVSQSQEHFFSIEPSTIRLRGENAIAQTVVQLGRGGVDTEIRVKAPGGYLVACPGDAENFVADCSLTLTRSQPFARVLVRREPEAKDGDPRALLRFQAEHRSRVVQIENTPAPKVAEVPLEGWYRGQAQLQAVISPETGRNALQAPPTLPVELVVGQTVNGRTPFSIQDPIGVFYEPSQASNQREITGYIERSGSAVALIPAGAQAWFELDHPALPKARAVSSWTKISQFSLDPTSVRFELEQSISLGVRPYILRWRFTLDRGAENQAVELVARTPAPVRPRVQPLVEAPYPIELGFHQSLGVNTSSASNYLGVQATICSRVNNPLYFDQRLAVIEAKVDGQPQRIYSYFDGELGCRANNSSERWPLFPLFAAETLSAEAHEQTFVACVNALQGQASGATEPCVEFSRLLAATNSALDSARRNGLGQRVEANVSAERLAAYLWVRYFDILDFLHEVERNGSAVRTRIELGDPPPTGFPDMVEMAGLIPELWAPILHPRNSVALRGLHPGALLLPDYRLEHALEDVQTIHKVDGDIHSTPLHVALMTGLAQHAEVWQRLADSLSRGETPPTRSDTVKNNLKEGLRRALVLRVIAEELLTKSIKNRADPTPPKWTDEYLAAQRRFASHISQTNAALQRKVAGLDELGLPWFRVGDQSQAGSRFRAMTDFLLGDGTELGGVVGSELNRAKDLRYEAVNMMARARNETFRLLNIEQRQDRELDRLALSLGSDAIDLCGYDRVALGERGGYAALAGEENPARCFIDTSERCQKGTPSAPEMGFKLCKAGEYARLKGVGAFTELLWLEALPADLPDLLGQSQWQFRTGNQQETIATVEIPGRLDRTELSVDTLESFLLSVRARGEPASFFTEVQARCTPVHGLLSAQGDPAEQCQVVVDAQDPTQSSAGECQGVGQYARGLGDLEPTCYKGELGELLIGVRNAELELQEAEAELQAVLDTYSAELGNCELQLSAYQQRETIYSTALSLLRDMRQQQVEFKAAAAAMGALSECLSARLKAFGSRELTGIFGAAVISSGICAAEASKAGLLGKVADIERDIANTEDQLKADIDLLNAELNLKTCFNSLQKNLAQLAPASVRIRSAVGRYLEAVTAFENGQRELERIYDDAKMWQSRLEQRKLSAIPQDYDFQERFVQFDRSVRSLKKALLYAGKAVEFELQQSILDDAKLRRTDDLDSLTNIARNLRSEVLSGRVSGGNATETRLVLSLKDDILRLPRPGQQPVGFHALEEGLALREVLLNRRNAVFDRQGKHIGQRIRFSLSPLGLEDGEAAVAAALGGAVCAERVWGLSAVIVGEEAVPFEAGAVSRMFLRKRNSFSSRACGGDGEIAGFISPESRNLGDVSGEDPGAQDRYTNALLDAEIYRSNYPPGARRGLEQRRLKPAETFELAGLGLYGDYQLFIPNESLGKNKLRLEGVEDIMLVFDLVLASKN